MTADDTGRDALIERVAQVIWETSRADESTISATGARIVATVVADAVVMPLVQERDRLQRGARTLGEMLDKQLRDVLDITGRHDCIDEDGDGDWGAVWDSLYSMKANLDAAIKRAEAAEAERDLLEAERDQALAELGRRK